MRRGMNISVNVYLAFSALLSRRHSGLPNRRALCRALATPPPLQGRHRYPRDDKNDTYHQTSTSRASEARLHIRKPERPNETPCRADEVDEDTDRCAVFDVRIDGVCDEDGGDDLVADRRDGHADLHTR